jgi:endogenous inhibitor of DNA gyrase (YacG/DUF329 family)
MQSQSARSVACPTCKKETIWSDQNKYRPFCSERCKLIDFGDWADGKHVIAGEATHHEEVDQDEESNY